MDDFASLTTEYVEVFESIDAEWLRLGFTRRDHSAASQSTESSGAKAPSARTSNPGLEQTMRALGVCQATKGVWWMPRRREAMKGVDSCEKLREAANRR